MINWLKCPMFVGIESCILFKFFYRQIFFFDRKYKKFHYKKKSKRIRYVNIIISLEQYNSWLFILKLVTHNQKTCSRSPTKTIWSDIITNSYRYLDFSRSCHHFKWNTTTINIDVYEKSTTMDKNRSRKLIAIQGGIIKIT